jgi:Predicted periplasmic protein
MEPDALIGLHQWNPQCDVMPADLQSQCRRQAEVATDHIFTYEAWLRSAGFDRELLQLQARTPAKDIAV